MDKTDIIISMLALGLLSWWYSQGWGIFVSGWRDRLKGTADFFSIGSLARTLFAPFRQISAHAGFLDRLISRLVGAATRFLIMIFGIIVIVLETILGLIAILVWPLVPLVPMACIVLTVVGVGNV